MNRTRTRRTHITPANPTNQPAPRAETWTDSDGRRHAYVVIHTGDTPAADLVRRAARIARAETGVELTHVRTAFRQTITGETFTAWFDQVTA